MSDLPAKIPATLPVGGNVGAIIPQSVEEIWRVSNMVIAGGFAPASLTGGKQGNEATSAVATAIMAGAELGLAPMASLRSFTVISGRPALYGDGLINVVRRSGKAEFIRFGFTNGPDDDTKVGWCEAKRKDTGEEHRVEFSIADAKTAGLWDEREKVTRYKKGGQGTFEAVNDAPWHRFWKRMLQWRATGYCLRELFADVLGGMTDEYEARDIAGETQVRDITPASPALTAPGRSLPAIPGTETASQDEPGEATQAAETSDEQSTAETDPPASEAPSEDAEYIAQYLDDLETALKNAKTADAVDAVFEGATPQTELADDEDALGRAFALKKGRLAEINRQQAIAAGQTDLLDGDGKKPFPGDLK